MSEPLTITRVTPSCHLIRVADATLLTGPWFPGRSCTIPASPWLPMPATCPFGDKAIPVIAAREVTVVISGGGRTICFGGDTLLIPWLRTLPGCFGRVAVALLPVNRRQIRPQLNRQIVMDARQAAEPTAVLRPQAAVPHHYAFTSGWPGDRLLTKSDSGPSQFVAAARQLAPGSAVQVLQPGQLPTLRTAAKDPATAGRPATAERSATAPN